jgi:hypothetical protein
MRAMITESEIVERLRVAVQAAGSQTAFANKHNINVQEVSWALGAKRKHRARISIDIAKVLGYRRVPAFEPLR